MSDLASASSLPLFVFANDGTVAWMRSGAKLFGVDPRTGDLKREVRLDPEPFGIAWRIERQGGFFVVRDDREIAAYDYATGGRLWKRTSPLDVTFAGEHEGRLVSLVPAEDGRRVDLALANLATGAFETKMRVAGTMTFVGGHGTLAGDLLFFATDQRDVFVVDVRGWQVAACHRMEGTHMLPPVATAAGVHVASVGHGETGAVTHVATLDRASGALLSSHVVPGAAHALTAGANGLVLEGRRAPMAPVERISFRPETPHLRLIAPKHIDMRLVKRDAPRLAPAGLGPRSVQGAPGAPAEILPAPRAHGAGERSEHRKAERSDERRDELLPVPRDGTESARESAREGLLGLLALLDARSDILVRLADACEERGGALARVERLGVSLRDPRARWSARAGRDPCLIDLAENREGDTLATYVYPPGASGRVPVVHVSRATGEARWLADDFDAWFAGVLYNAQAYAPDAVRATTSALGLPPDFPRPLPSAMAPRWFFEAHATRWTLSDADTALAAGDVEGAERMLVAIGRARGGTAHVKERLASVYAVLGWDHHRAQVVETW